MTTEEATALAPKHPKLLELEPKLKALEDALLKVDPQMPFHLKEIHKHLIQYEELAHLLSEDQIAVILEAQQKKLGVILANETTKSKGNSKIKGGVSADDL